MKLRYDSPASRWTEALPLGNGRLGAMVFGGVARDRFQINDDTCWTGSPETAHGDLAGYDGGPAALARIREALSRGDFAAATAAEQEMQQGWSQAYQPFVDLTIVSDDGVAAGYTRSLDLADAIAESAWSTPDGTVKQRSWVSAPDRVLVIERVADGVLMSGRVELATLHHELARTLSAAEASLTVRLPSDVRRGVPKTEDLVRDLTFGASITAHAGVRLVHDGTGGTDLSFTGASRLLILIATATDFAGGRVALHGDPEVVAEETRATLDSALRLGPDALCARHVADHRSLYERMALNLGGDEAREVNVGDLRAHTEATGDDRQLAAVVFGFGRYLTIAASRAGSRPMNLQGIWNENPLPPWRCNYTTNINVEMNYWPTEAVNLSECNLPLLDWLEDVAASGERTAQELYGMSGWTVHHNSDVWGFSVPVGDRAFDPVWSMWPLGGAWLCRHVWERWQFTQDDDELRDRGWPLLTGAARFILDWLVELAPGEWGTSPSTSPENKFVIDGGVTGLTVSTTADLALIRDLFSACVAAAGVLGIDDELVARISAVLPHLPTERLAADGTLSEWYDDVADAEPGHRHQSHLYGLMPGEGVLPWLHPDLTEAAARSLDARGRRTTGWSLAWRVALRARLRDGEAAHRALADFLAPLEDPDNPGPSGTAGLYGNLFCAHPPFQIDGNFGVTAAILEMVVQSHGGRIVLLPALPEAWPSGSVRGARIRGGGEIDVDWAEGGVTRVEVRSVPGRSFLIEIDGEARAYPVPSTGRLSLEFARTR